MAADNTSKQYLETIKRLKDIVDKQKSVQQSTEAIKESWKAISSELFKIDGADFFKQVPKSTEELKQMSETVSELQEKFNEAGKGFSEMISPEVKQELLKTFESISTLVYTTDKDGKKVLDNTEAISAELRKIRANNTALSILDDNALLDFAEKIKLQKSLNKDSLDWEKIIQGTNKEQKLAIGLMHDNADAFNEFNDVMSDSAEAAAKIREEMLKPNEVFTLGKNFENVFIALGKRMKNELIGTLTEFDRVLHDVQKNTSINMVANTQAFSKLTTEVSQYGVSIEGAGKLMADMSKELRTTNFNVLATAAKDFAAIEGATGASAEDISTIAGELMRMGESSGQVKDFMQEADQQARMFGVSSSKVLGGISKNIKKMREMGFTGGEKSLMKMAVTAERLGMNIDETFDMAKKARSIEGAMDMAAELQLAGGSFANINPMDLLSAARKGPAELQKILTSMGKDIGHFDQEQQKYVFDPVDVDRLQMVSEATGQSMESLQNMISKNADDVEKTNMFSSLIDSMDAADKDLAKSNIADMMKKTKDGKIEFDASSDMAKRMGINSLEELQGMSSADLKTKMEADKVTLEEQNRRNQDLKQSFDNFMNGLLSALTVFQPLLEILGDIFQRFSKTFAWFGDTFGRWSQVLISGLILAFGIFGTNVTKMIGGMAGNIKGKIAKMFNNDADSTPDNMNSSVGGAGGGGGIDMAKKWEGIKDKMTNIAGGIKDTVSGILKFVTDIIGEVTNAISRIIQSIGGVITSILDVLQSAVKGIGKIFVTIMSSIGQGITAFATSAAVGLGILTPFIPVIIVLAAAIIGLAFAFKLFAEGLASLAPLITAVFNGIATVITSIGSAVSAVIGTIADSIVKLSSVNGANLFILAGGLLALSGSLMAFGAGSMVGGIMSMFGGGMFTQISELALMAPAISLLANSLNSAADGIMKLSEAAEKLNIDKLEKLKDVSMGLANNMKKANENESQRSQPATQAKGGDGEARKIEINLKINGRDLQNFIVADTKIVK